VELRREWYALKEIKCCLRRVYVMLHECFLFSVYQEKPCFSCNQATLQTYIEDH
jgi:hypothetical protein